ncbi:MAG: DUF721 domain-containing protein [Nitrosomonas sp.]|nr:MAG: DUF721 domain-containing protein [Nitrosomonas sp.]
MTSRQIRSYFNVLEKTPDYADIFSSVRQLHEYRSAFLKHLPPGLMQHCSLGRISQGKLTIMASHGAIASKLKQNTPSLLLKLQQCGLEVTSFQILVQADYTTIRNKSLYNKTHNPKKPKLNPINKDCLDQFAKTLPDSDLKTAVLSLARKCQPA